ncbi:OLC1v1036680C1 [Oldenlandia corymbosa var. corymbosa]|uniref:OLC1v1036680C1 n=1 Tax=Oldenlandia corymbosa var. corymbosa TaxID=529605 RepID=A0AAV1CYL1_OLDCO|nr:OLC1v1036680C1 [Oldenlandia corymbosa var. corymbosa]
MFSVQPILSLPPPPSDENMAAPPVSPVPTTAAVATHTRTIGIIHPPKDIRDIVYKTSQFVAKKGPEIEKRIIADYSGSTKLNFLKPSDPYHAYYQHLLAEARADPDKQPSESTDSAASPPAPVAAPCTPVYKVLEPPEAEQYTVFLPEGSDGEELDIIKLAAQFVARNGISFLTGLANRELTNPQFQFLRTTNSKFVFFTSLSDAYSKILQPPKGLIDKLRNSVVDRTTVLEHCLRRLEWDRSQELARQRAEEETELERMQMAAIDWHDFVMVDIIDFADDEDEDLPHPMTHEEVIRMSKVSSSGGKEEDFVDPGKEVAMEMDEEEMELVKEGIRAAEENELPMRIVKNWKRPEDRLPNQRDPSPTTVVISPITGERIPINEMSEHIRISLIDPKYKEQKERMFAKIRDTTLAPDDEITKNIVGLARTRPDIFGTTEEEVSSAVKAEIEKKKDVIWDGHAGSIAPTRNQAHSHTSGKDPIEANMETRNLPGPVAGIPSIQSLPPPPTFRPLLPLINMPLNPPAPGPFVHMPIFQPGIHMPPLLPSPDDAPPPPPEEPAPKRQKLDDSALILEDQFLAQYPGPARINVSVPNLDGRRIKGNVLEITMQSLSETISSLKEQIAGEIQLPANKQKLSGKAGFLKDNVSLAYYNVAPGDTLALSLRERGGRKR